MHKIEIWLRINRNSVEFCIHYVVEICFTRKLTRMCDDKIVPVPQMNTEEDEHDRRIRERTDELKGTEQNSSIFRKIGVYLMSQNLAIV